MRLVSDDNLAVMLLWGECRGEIFDGKVAVAEVIRNRTNRRYASNGTIASTLFWPYQFSCFNTDNDWRHKIFEIDNADFVVRECYNAWVKSEATNLTKGAVLYANLHILKDPPRWASAERFLAEIGMHTFFADPPVTTKV